MSDVQKPVNPLVGQVSSEPVYVYPLTTADQVIVDETNNTRLDTIVNTVNDLINIVYPVGSIYMSVNEVSPRSFLGGTWERITDRFLLAAGTSYAAGSTGGAASVTLTAAQMPRHGHNVCLWNANNTNYDAYQWNDAGNGAVQATKGGRLPSLSWQATEFKTAGTSTLGGDWSSGLGTGDIAGPTTTSGGGAAHNNMPPYLTVYMWKRTA